MGFFTALENRAGAINSLLCVGLDPHPGELTAPTAEAARDFCMRLVDATWRMALAYKPNAAFFEALGPAGWQALVDVIAAIPAGIPVVLDAKRGDIASTAEAYARSAFQTLKAHAITLSPYLGKDSLAPFSSDPAHGVFLLCKTSNPGSADLQDLVVQGDLTVYEQVALLAQTWNEGDNLGLVVGATYPAALQRVRSIAPDLWILAPGLGAQGGDLESALQAGLRSDRMGLLLPVSRAISRSSNPGQAAEDLRAAINRSRQAFHSSPPQVLSPRVPSADVAAEQGEESLPAALLQAGCVQFGDFTLKSGKHSPIYIDLRRLVAYPKLLSQVATAYSAILKKLHFDRLAALPYAALPIGTAISLEGGWPLIYPRKEAKDYGTRAEIEGIFNPREQVAIIDDLATTGRSKFEAIARLTASGLEVRDVVVLIDRQSGARQALSQAGLTLHAVFTLSALLDAWESSGRITPDQISAARREVLGN